MSCSYKLHESNYQIILHRVPAVFRFFFLSRRPHKLGKQMAAVSDARNVCFAYKNKNKCIWLYCKNNLKTSSFCTLMKNADLQWLRRKTIQSWGGGGEFDGECKQINRRLFSADNPSGKVEYNLSFSVLYIFLQVNVIFKKLVYTFDNILLLDQFVLCLLNYKKQRKIQAGIIGPIKEYIISPISNRI